MNARYGLSARLSWLTRVAHVPPSQDGNEDGMTEAGDREQLGESLDQPDDHGLQIGHVIDRVHAHFLLVATIHPAGLGR